MPGALMPALLKSTSNRLKASLVRAKSARTRSGLLTSVGTGSIWPPEGFAKAAVCSSSATRRPASTTEYPADCNARLTARPMPLLAPVTSAILPLVIIFVLSPRSNLVQSGSNHSAQIGGKEQMPVYRQEAPRPFGPLAPFSGGIRAPEFLVSDASRGVELERPRASGKQEARSNGFKRGTQVYTFTRLGEQDGIPV